MRIQSYRQVVAIVTFLSIIMVVVPYAPVAAQATPNAVFAIDHAPGRLLVKFRDGTSSEDKDAAKRAANAHTIRSLPAVGLEEIELPPDQIMQAYEQLVRTPQVEYVTPDYIVRPSAEPTDPYYTNGSQWAPAKIDAPAVWNMTGGEGIVIAILDSGVEPTHPDLVDRLVPGFNTLTGTTDTSDGCGHGTHVAGIAAATANNGQGIAGIAYASRIMPIKTIDDSCSGTLGTMIHGIAHATDQGARIVSISSGTLGGHAALKDIINYARSKGTIVIAAAGNYNSSDPFYPASYPETIAVSGTDSADARYAYSNYGSQIDLAAPGKSVYSTYRNATYASMSGTSMSAPHVAGVAALILARNPNLTAEQLEQTLLAGVDDLGDPGWDPYFGHGRLNAARALNAAPQPGLRVTDLDGTAANQQKKWVVTVNVAVADGQNRPLSGATVQGTWSGSTTGAAQCTTGPDGGCTLTSPGMRSFSSVTFAVTNVLHTTEPYQPSANYDPDGDSNGSSITVQMPVTEDSGSSNTKPGKGGGKPKTSVQGIGGEVYLPLLTQ